MENCKTGFKAIFIFVHCLWAVHAGAQSNVLKGTVQNENGTSVVGASVVVSNETRQVASTSTDSEGTFTISGLQTGGPYRITYSHVAYETLTESGVTVPAGGTERAVVLKSVSMDMEEVVVVGYGTQARRNVTTSISQY